jgi:hypothetical protein
MVGLDERHERLPLEVLRHAPRGERRVAGGRLEDRRMSPPGASPLEHVYA